MDVDPFSVFFSVIRIAAVIIALIFFAIIYTAFTTDIKANDMERYTVELAENIMNSEITSSKYVFDKEKMDSLNGKEIGSLRSCWYSYSVIVDDLVTGEEWEFGSVPESSDTHIIKDFYASVLAKTGRSENFYETVHQAKVSLGVHDYLASRVACTIEKAYIFREIQNLTIGGCSKSGSCFSFRKSGNKACIFSVVGSGKIDDDCKTIPAGINFEEIYETKSSLKAKGIDTDVMNILAYPLKTMANCNDVKNNPSAYIAGSGDAVQTVLLCVENYK